jgi:SAM-dependent methyltransferase
MDNQSIGLQQDMDRVRSTYDAVAVRYAEAMVKELDERPIERGLLDEVVRGAREGDRRGPIADVGCGPGHVARYLADRGAEVCGFDLSPAMIDLARARFPGLDFRVGSMLAIDAKEATWSGAVALYSLIHLTPNERTLACHELARMLRPNAPLLVSFHVSSPDNAMGSSVHLETWFEMPVDLTGYFLDPDVVLAEMRDAGFELRARLDREPLSANEYPSRRCYLLLRRASPHRAA